MPHPICHFQVNSIGTFISALLEDELKGGLLDSNVAGFYKNKLEQLKLTNIFEDIEYSYGFVITNQLNNIILPKVNVTITCSFLKEHLLYSCGSNNIRKISWDFECLSYFTMADKSYFADLT